MSINKGKLEYWSVGMMGKKEEIRRKKTQQRGLGCGLYLPTHYSNIPAFHYSNS
jgi:hypothetical protein